MPNLYSSFSFGTKSAALSSDFSTIGLMTDDFRVIKIESIRLVLALCTPEFARCYVVMPLSYSPKSYKRSLKSRSPC